MSVFISKINRQFKEKKRLDLKQDPPPDLVVEIDITSRSESSLEVYADLGVPEVWLYDGDRLTVKLLQKREYVSSDRSLAFPTLPLSEISQFLARAETTDYLDLVRAFHFWVKSQLQP